MRALFRVGLRDLVRRPLFSGLMLSGLALGVAVVVSIDLASQSALNAFEYSSQTVVGRATHRIIGGPSGVPESLYRELRVGRRLRTTTPIVDGYAAAVDLDERPVRVLGIDLFTEAPFRDHLDAELAFQPGFQAFFTERGMVIIGEQFSQTHGVELGSQITLQVNDRLTVVTVLGILDTLGASELLVMDLVGAQELFGMPERLSRIDLIADAISAERLASELPTGIRVVPFSQEVETANELTSAFRLNLTALSLLALIVGVFLVYNTMTFSVLSRRPVLGTLRTLGASEPQIFALILLEAVSVAFVGSALGVVLGYLLSQFSVSLVSQTINDLYFLLSVQERSLTTAIVLKGLALGVGAAVLAAIVPALEAARVPPIQMLSRSDVERGVQIWIPRVGLLGIALAALGLFLILKTGNSLAATFAAILVFVLGIALLVPLATRWVMRGLTPLSRKVQWRMAVRGLVSQISRTGIAITALMVALSVAISVTLMIESFRATVENWLDLTLFSDIYVSSPAVVGGRPQSNLPSSLKERLSQVPGVDTVEGIRAAQVESEFGQLELTAVDAERARDAALYRFAQGSASEVWARVRQGAVVVSESLDFRHDIGEAVVLETDRGPQSFEVVGVFYDYSSDQGRLLMSREAYAANWDDPALSSLGVKASEGWSPSALAEDLREELVGSGLSVQVNQDLRLEALRIFDRTFAITNAIRLLAVLVAFIGVLSALLALQLERRREGGVLQAVGLAPDGLKVLTLLESSLIGLVAALLAIPTGILLALILIQVINVRSFGWTIQLQTSPEPFLQALIVGLVASMVAAIYPILRLRKTTIAEALRGE